MLGVLLAGLSSGLGELSDSIGKKEVRERVASYYTFGFLNLLFGSAFFFALGIIHNNFIFSLASFPTFLPRAILEIVLAHITVKAVMQADRGDFAFLKSVTIPLLLTIDLMLGYTVTIPQMLGIIVIFAAIFLLFFFEHFQTKARWLLLGSALIAAVTISLYKYDITHFNSVESEQSIISLIVMLYFFVLATLRAKENPLSLLSNPYFAVQSISSGLASVVGAYAYFFAPASVITAALRASAVLFAVISGTWYFNEKRSVLKCVLFLAIAGGLILLFR